MGIVHDAVEFGLKLVGDIVLSGVELAGSLAPVPWLSPALGLVKDIVALVQNVPTNR